jgi:hypothetical protein
MKTETTLWACGIDYHNLPIAVLVPVKETAKMFILDKDRLPADSGPIYKALDFKTNIQKSEKVLFPTREAAIRAKIDALTAESQVLLNRAGAIQLKIQAAKALL